MRKILILLVLLISIPAWADMTITSGDGFQVQTASQIYTTGTNSTSNFQLGRFESGAFQCVWASVTGTQPVYKLQLSNDNSNWDDYLGASTTTSGASGSGVWLVDPIVARYARVYVATTSTAGTLDCIATLQGE